MLGAFANGKTTALIAEALKLCVDYPGSVGMLGAAVFADMEKTVVREFERWCPPTWIKSFPKNSMTCTMHNGTVIDFRYVARREGDGAESGTSHLLSSNYDWIGVDQMERPEITQNDFNHLMGRLRGQTPYAGAYANMPLTGPRWLLLTANPALGWLYKQVVKPRHDFDNGLDNPLLICERDEYGNRILDANDRPQPMVELFEATTFDNAQNLQPDYLKGLLSTYNGKMRDRYIYGKWTAFEGVIYGEHFDSNIHMVPHKFMLEHMSTLRAMGYQLELIEGYDFGIAKPSCYMLGLVDANGTIYVVAGFYEARLGITEQANRIHQLRSEYASVETMRLNVPPFVRADPQIFKDTNAGKQTVGDSIAKMFQDEDVFMVRGNNNVQNGILKVQEYLRIDDKRPNPFTYSHGAPSIYFSDTLHWFVDEIENWRWKQAKDEGMQEAPADGDDHALDTLKYMLSLPPKAGQLVGRRETLPKAVRQWMESDTTVARDRRHHRYTTA